MEIASYPMNFIKLPPNFKLWWLLQVIHGVIIFHSIFSKGVLQTILMTSVMFSRGSASAGLFLQALACKTKMIRNRHTPVEIDAAQAGA